MAEPILPRREHTLPLRRIAPQRNDVLDSPLFISCQHLVDLVFGLRRAGDVGHHQQPFLVLDPHRQLFGQRLRRTPRPVRHGHVIGRVRLESANGSEKGCDSGVCLWREELEGEGGPLSEDVDYLHAGPVAPLPFLAGYYRDIVLHARMKHPSCQVVREAAPDYDVIRWHIINLDD